MKKLKNYENLENRENIFEEKSLEILLEIENSDFQ